MELENTVAELTDAPVLDKKVVIAVAATTLVVTAAVATFLHIRKARAAMIEQDNTETPNEN